MHTWPLRAENEGGGEIGKQRGKKEEMWRNRERKVGGIIGVNMEE